MSATQAAIDAEFKRMRADGFLGMPRSFGQSSNDAGHYLCVRSYWFPDGTIRLFVEVAEEHNGWYAARIRPLPEVVHLLQNVTETEFHAIGGLR